MFGIRFLAQLVLAQARAQPTRVWLTCLAIVASSAAVTWVVSGYDALVANFDENAREFLGRYDLVVVPANLPFGTIAPVPETLVNSLRRDPGIREVNPIAQSRATVTPVAGRSEARGAIDMLVGSRPPVNGAPPLDPVLVATAADEAPYELVAGRWLSAGSADREAVVSAGAAERLDVEVGAEILVTTISNRQRLRVVGLVEEPAEAPNLETIAAPSVAAPAEPKVKTSAPVSENAPPQQSIGMPIGVVNSPAIEAVYVRVPVADKINGYPAKVNLLQVALREGVTPDDFRQTWGTKLAGESPCLVALDFQAVRSGMKGSYTVSSELAQAYSATGLAALASVFIIFTTLSMGVTERTRQFALLRAIALTRWQVGAMIVVESLMLGLVGWIGGLVAGQAILSIASAARPDFFQGDLQLGGTCVWLTGGSVLAGAVGAAVLPAWQAMRIRPLDAASDQPLSSNAGWPWISSAVGVGLMLVAPLSVFLLSMDNASRTLLYAVLSYPTLLLGVVCLAPACMLASRTYLAPLLARCLGLPPLLLASQLHTDRFRTLGATLALTSGLALYSSTQIWGHTMLQNYIPGKWLPDALVAFHPMGLADEQRPLVAQIPGIEANEVLPLAVEQARFAWPAAEAPANLRRDNAVVIGLDVERAFGGDRPLLDLEFLQGNRADLIEQLLSGKHCLVPEDFTTLTGLGVGDRIPFSPPNAPEKIVEYEIAGVVATPGWQWMTKFSGVRRHYVRTFAIVFADAARVRSDFQLQSHEFFWLNLDGTRPLEQVEDSLQSLAEKHAGGQFNAGDYGRVTAHRPFARLTATQTVRQAITMVAQEVIWGMSQLPLITLAITSLAVANTIAASVRARKWQLGVLRAIGITRSQVVRLVLSEAILIAVVACLLSLAFGLVASWCSVGMSRYSGMFYSPPHLRIPWLALGGGFAAAIALSLAAALGPAIALGRNEPLSLLRARQ